VAGAAVVWRGTRVVGVIEETARARTIVLEVPGWPGHSAGQHVDLRLTAEDGYQTERRIRSPPRLKMRGWR
jgi:ferredoxin-NADP reductase